MSKRVDFSRGAEAGKAGEMATLCKNSELGGVKKHHKGSAVPLEPTAIGKKSREKPEHMEVGVCAGIIQQCHLPLQGGDYFGGEGQKETITPPSWAIPAQTHTHREGTHMAERFQVDMLTCRQATPLPCRKGRRGCKGHGGGQLKREAVGRGIETPGSESRAKTKRKDGGWSLKTKQNIVNSAEGRGQGARIGTRMQHTWGILSTPGPSRASHLLGMRLWASLLAPQVHGSPWKLPRCGMGQCTQPGAMAVARGSSPPAAACRPC